MIQDHKSNSSSQIFSVNLLDHSEREGTPLITAEDGGYEAAFAQIEREIGCGPLSSKHRAGIDTLPWFHRVRKGLDPFSKHRKECVALLIRLGALTEDPRAHKRFSAGEITTEHQAVSVLIADLARRRYAKRIARIRCWTGGVLSADLAIEWLLREAEREALAKPQTIELPDDGPAENCLNTREGMLAWYKVSIDMIAASAGKRLHGDPKRWPRGRQHAGQIEFDAPGSDGADYIPYYQGFDFKSQTLAHFDDPQAMGKIRLIYVTAAVLSETLHWEQAAAVWFLLCDGVPDVNPYSGNIRVANGGFPTEIDEDGLISARLDNGTKIFLPRTWSHPMRLNRVTLVIDPTMSPKEVAELYSDVRSRWIPHYKAPSKLNLRLAMFAYSAECARLNWEDRMQRWNDIALDVAGELAGEGEIIRRESAIYDRVSLFREHARDTRKRLLFPGRLPGGSEIAIRHDVPDDPLRTTHPWVEQIPVGRCATNILRLIQDDIHGDGLGMSPSNPPVLVCDIATHHKSDPWVMGVLLTSQDEMRR